ncbi:MAG TPA: acyl-CoA dehydrogenase [Methylococcaceae bacterium]|nr:acyl-CoA dehydrogenase [Methylococcaceae bacterium]
MLWLLTSLLAAALLAYHRVALHWASLAFAVLLGGWTVQQGWAPMAPWLWGAFAVVFVPLNLPFLRRQVISKPILRLMSRAMPPISQTEREALEAGNVWWDAQLFSGSPDWKVLLDLSPARLTPEEQAFLDGPVETLCAMLDDWDITHRRRDLPPAVWEFIKHNKFCGMIIPREYGGLDFSNFAHSEIVMKIASRSTTAAVTVMVPNSLGPAKLLLAYGTEAQKNHYLPRLAAGEEIPAFALTGPHAGSDAGAMPDRGVVCYGTFQGQDQVLGIRLNWEKRYITLGPVATVLGLAFKLSDPDHLIGEKEDIGITVALIPTGTPGVAIGRRHFPLDSAFQNGPNWGKDVFIPLDWIIGGVAQVGNGWKMLMQCLATGRAISLPALGTGAAKFTCRNAGAYARIRKQFNRPLGDFDGIQESLARMAGETYILDAARQVTAAALDEGQKPSVVSAMIKYELTERMRRVVNDGMDILGGAGICLGPRNFLGRVYQVIPISITVEGANIVTRTLMIFGQGLVRCHPYLQMEMATLHDADPARAAAQFDAVLFAHLGFVLRNLVAAIWLGLTGARLLPVPGDRITRRYYRRIARLSSAFALMADFALLSLGGALKRKERISGRFADVLSNLYLCSCVLKHDRDRGSPTEDRPLLHWACQHTLYQAQQSLLAIFRQLPLRPLVWLLRLLVFPTGAGGHPPGERLIHQAASILLTDTPARDRLTHGIYVDREPGDATGRIEVAFQAVLAAAPVETKMRHTRQRSRLKADDPAQLVKQALSLGIITPEEADLLEKADQARLAAITVDDFSPDELTGGG